MMPDFSITYNKRILISRPCCVSPEKADSARLFHSGIPGYSPTLLVSLPSLANAIGCSQFFVKDESNRFSLNSFKALGGSYAIARYICQKLGIALDRKTFELLHSEEYLSFLSSMTFVTATDGNHGRGVAWTAQVLGCKSVNYLPFGTTEERRQNVIVHGAKAKITSLNYDNTVRLAAETAKKNGWILVQDTSWPGYEDIPSAIMQGYTTLAYEIAADLGNNIPTHLFLQAGVGSMAGAIAGYFSSLWHEKRPKIIIVEPNKADCLYRTALADDGRFHCVTGNMDSMMAGLCCGVPCTLGWEILKDLAYAFISCDDSYAADGMRLLGRPFGRDPKIESGESGAVTTGVATAIMTCPELAGVKSALGMDSNSRILVISTEGATDRANYERIMNKHYT